MSRRIELVSREVRTRQKMPVSISEDCEGMINRFRKNIESIKGLNNIYNLLMTENQPEKARDILRFQIVYLMSSLDFYLHELYVYGILKIFQKQKQKNLRYLEYRVPLEVVEKALYDGENIMSHLKQAVIENNSTLTFMHPNRMKEVLHTISEAETFDLVEEKLKRRHIIKSYEALEVILENLYRRRNRISHQTDIEHGGTEQGEINHYEVMRSIDIVAEMIETLHQIIMVS